jgi:hypothetical protein
MAYKKGRDMLVSVDGDQVLGEVQCQVDADHGEIAINPKGEDGTVYIYDGQNCTIKVSGVVNDSDTAVKAFLTAMENGAYLNNTEVVTGLGAYSAASWFCAGVNFTGASGSEQQFDFTLKASGGYTFTAV